MALPLGFIRHFSDISHALLCMVVQLGQRVPFLGVKIKGGLLTNWSLVPDQRDLCIINPRGLHLFSVHISEGH